MATKIWVNIGSGNGLLPDGTKPLPEPMLTNPQRSQVSFILGQFHKRCLNHQSLKSVWKLHVWNFIQISQGPISSVSSMPQLPTDGKSTLFQVMAWCHYLSQCWPLCHHMASLGHSEFKSVSFLYIEKVKVPSGNFACCNESWQHWPVSVLSSA